MEIGYNEGGSPRFGEAGSYDDKELHKHRSKKLSESKIKIDEKSKQLQSTENKV